MLVAFLGTLNFTAINEAHVSFKNVDRILISQIITLTLKTSLYGFSVSKNVNILKGALKSEVIR